MASELLSRVIDDYIGWLAAWHRVALADNAPARAAALPAIQSPEAFPLWQTEAAKLLQDQPAVEKVAALHEQLHTLVRLVLMKTPEPERIARSDDDGIIAKYRELMQGLRRLERAFAAAASELDPLTGLHSRTTLTREIERELHRFARTGRVFCVAIMDIDHFKKINDTYGHDVGDKVLASVADHVSRSLRAHDDAYRLGGEEFLLCLKEADLDVGRHVLERVRATLKQSPVVLASGPTVPVTASFGLAGSALGLTPDELLRRADQALYRAKHEGRDRIVTADS